MIELGLQDSLLIVSDHMTHQSYDLVTLTTSILRSTTTNSRLNLPFVKQVYISQQYFI